MNYLRYLVDRVTYPFRVILRSPLSLFSKPSRVVGMSQPVRLALFAWLILIFIVIASSVIYYRNYEKRFWLKDRWDDSPVIVIIGCLLLFVIPFAVYKVVRLWLEGDPIPFERIEKAWDYGIKALREHGLELSDAPLFLITGIYSDVQARALMHASGISFSVNGVPEGPAALHWFANDDVIFLVLTEVSHVGLVTKLVAEAGERGMQNTAERPRAAARAFMGTYSPADDDQEAAATAATAIGDIDTGGFDVPASGGPNYGASLVIGDHQADLPVRNPTAPVKAIPASVRLTDAQNRDMRDKMRYVGTRLRYARQPYCPVNGLLNLLPFGLIQSSDPTVEQLKRAAQEDLDVLSETLRVRCPVSVVISGMECESGFRELCRRLGYETVKSHRFGKGADVWTPPTPEYLEAVTRTAIGAFEDWAYQLFSTGEGLSHLGNPKLYSLLCRVRTDLQERLVNTVCDAYGREVGSKNGRDAMLFSGCYFAATGTSDDQQAFVRSIVVDKMMNEEAMVSWTSNALDEDERYGFFAFVGNCVILVEIILIAVFAYLWYTQ